MKHKILKITIKGENWVLDTFKNFEDLEIAGDIYIPALLNKILKDVETILRI
jgi:hypothetical protein